MTTDETCLFDLHSHTLCSDGALSPKALIELAKQQGVTHLAITDHDTVAGVLPGQKAGSELGVHVVAGVEISSRWRHCDIHIVGLGVNCDDASFLERLESQAERRLQRAQLICKRLDKPNCPPLWPKLMALTAGKPPGRPDIAALLIEQGRCKTHNEAFRKYLGAGKSGYVTTSWPDISESITWIKDAGGIAVLAHPAKYKLTRTKLCELLADFSEAGGQAMEVACTGLDPNKTGQLARLANDYGLLASQGSDFHSPNMPWVKLGKMPPMPKQCRPIWAEYSLL